MNEENNHNNLDERVKWIEYLGKKILFIDFSNLDENNILKIYDIFEPMLLDKEGGNFLVLIDCSGTIFSNKVKRRAKDLVEKTKINRLTAIAGFRIMQKIILNGLTSDNFHFVDDIKEGKNWLIEQSNKQLSLSSLKNL